MAERDELMRALGRHDAGDAGRAQHIAFHRVAVEHDVECFRLHHDAALSHRRPLGRVLARYVNHPRLAALAEMTELGGGVFAHGYLAAWAGTRSRCSSARVAAATSFWRIRLSPTRNALMPTAA